MLLNSDHLSRNLPGLALVIYNTFLTVMAEEFVLRNDN